jgi:hypothetical protein
MGKWLDNCMAPADSTQAGDHIAAEDIARLAEGSVDPDERTKFLHHLNRCHRCYEVLQETIRDITPAEPSKRISAAWRQRKTIYAVAASILLVLIFGGRLVFERFHQPPRIITATLNLNQELKDILLENDALRWENGPRLNRLAAVLHKKGLQFQDLKAVVLAQPYYQKKSLFGPPEKLHVRIENGVAYLSVEEKK